LSVEPTRKNEAGLKISAVVLALNEEKTIGEIVSEALLHVDEVVVVDDGGTDDTGRLAEQSGAKVIRNESNMGILHSLRKGFSAANGDIIVTLDGDGQHSPSDIPVMLEPILEGKADLVIGRRPDMPHFSEKVISHLTRLKVDISDASTGFRAIKASVAKEMSFHGTCACGTFILEAYSLGARITEVPISIREREHGERRIQTKHFYQALYVLYDLLRYA